MFGSTTKIKTSVIAICILALAGCSATYRNHGYIPTDEDLGQIQIGVDTKDSEWRADDDQ